jgi:hypothetical protein
MKATLPDNQPKPATATNACEASCIDASQLATALIDLNIARKTVHIYPPHHDQVRLSLARAYKSLTRILQVNKHLTLGIGRETLLIGGEPLDPKNKAFGEFAQAFRQHEIAGVTFTRGLEPVEMMAFLTWSAQRPEDCPKLPPSGNPTTGQTALWPHIGLTLVDYTQIQLTEETATGCPGSEEGKEATSLWSEFVNQLVAGTLTREEDGIALNELKALNPKNLAQLLNESRLDAQTALRSFNHLLQQENQAIRQTPKPPAAAGAQPQGLNEFGQLLEELNPDLQRQFLSLTGAFAQPGVDPAGTAPMSSGDSYPLVIEMLRKANAKAQEVSPSLIRLVQKITETGGQQSAQNPTVDHDLASPAPFGNTSKDQFNTLFQREDYESYVSEDYHALLEKAGRAKHPEPSLEETVLPMDEHLATLEDHHLEAQISRLVMAFMQHPIGAQEYQAYAERLVTMAYTLLDAQRFDLLMQFHRLLNLHAKEKAEPQIRKIAEETIEKFSSPLMTSKAVSVFHLTQQPASGKAFDFLIALGPKIVPDVIRFYAEQDRPHANSPLLALLNHFRNETIQEAQRRLLDSRVGFVSRLIVLLRTLNARDATGPLLQMLDHYNEDVQLEALAALMKLGDERALPYLRKTIKSARRPVSDRVIELAGRYRVKWVAPELANMIKRFIFFRSDYPRNNKLIQALGRIGDGCAVTRLNNLAKKTWGLYPAELRRMQRILFHSLGHYAYEDVRELLHIGFKSKDETIRRACQKVLDTKGKVRLAIDKKRNSQ